MMFIYCIIYLVCSVLSYGISFAYLQREYPIQAGMTRTSDMWFSIAVSLFGPLSLIINYTTTGLAKHGLMFKRGESE